MGLTAEFHENFRRKAFFDQPWKPRKESGWKSSRRKSPRGMLLVATGKLRRSLKAQTTASRGAIHLGDTLCLDAQ